MGLWPRIHTDTRVYPSSLPCGNALDEGFSHTYNAMSKVFVIYLFYTKTMSAPTPIVTMTCYCQSDSIRPQGVTTRTFAYTYHVSILVVSCHMLASAAGLAPYWLQHVIIGLIPWIRRELTALQPIWVAPTNIRSTRISRKTDRKPGWLVYWLHSIEGVEQLAFVHTGRRAPHEAVRVDSQAGRYIALEFLEAYRRYIVLQLSGIPIAVSISFPKSLLLEKRNYLADVGSLARDQIISAEIGCPAGPHFFSERIIKKHRNHD